MLLSVSQINKLNLYLYALASSSFERPGGPALRKGGEDKAKKVKSGMFASGMNFVKKAAKTSAGIAGNIEKKVLGKNKFCAAIIRKIGEKSYLLTSKSWI